MASNSAETSKGRTKRYRVKKGRLIEDSAYLATCDTCGDLQDEYTEEHVARTSHTVTVSVDCFRIYKAVKK